VRSRRAWLYVLSVAALLVPAGGIAYLGAVSYRDERGAVASRIERQRQAALAITGRIDRAIDAALDDADRAAAGGADARPSAPLASYWFWIDASGQLRVPRAVPADLAADLGAFDHGAACSSDNLEGCVRELATRRSRVAKLHAAERLESGGQLADAKNIYESIAPFDDVGPAALLGLARVARKPGDRADALAKLEHRFATRAFDGVPVVLAAAALRAEDAGPAALLELAGQVASGRYAIDAMAALGIVARLRALASDELPPELTRARSALDERVAARRVEARAAAGLAGDVAELARTATPTWRGRTSARQPSRTLAFRRRGDGGVIGIAVDGAMLVAAAGREPGDDVAPHVRPVVLAVGAAPPPGTRVLEQVPLGEALPHLALAIVQPLADPDPIDEVIAERSRRHVVLTSALALALGLGLVATIRGAARARELARLKSDFVSTVSHELKTPLTSIRMFAEMLEQGVAKGDAAKLARYHGVIVQQSQRLGLLIANLLDYAQIERGTRRYAPTAQRVGELARLAVQTYESLEPPAEAEPQPRNRIDVAVSSGAADAEIDVDRDVVLQAVLNLIGNAVKYGGAGKPIEVEVGADADAAWIAVRDHGPGIAAAEQSRIFREFYRAPDAYRSGVEGTGLGLALVKRHVEALGGEVEVTSQVGHGARFALRFPRARRDRDRGAA
jgi:signal transduction histidine kinase